MAPLDHWWPSWLWLGSPLKVWLWVINRLATLTGVLYFWKRIRARRFFWAWLMLINMASLGCLGLVLFWLRHAHGR